MTTQLLDSALLVPGQRVAQKAQDLGFKQLVVAENARAASLYKALLEQ